MTDDIVARLRQLGKQFHATDEDLDNAGCDLEWQSVQMAGETIVDAIDEIERLREALRLEQEELAACCIDRRETQRERDEARRRVCENAIQHGRVYRRVGRDTVRCETPQQVAEVMGWDCFKEVADGK